MGIDIRTERAKQTSYREEIDRLTSLEENNHVDIIIRLIGVPFGSILFYLYAEDTQAFAWSIGYVVMYLLYRLYLLSCPKLATYAHQMGAHAMIFFLTLSFIWFPTLMLVDQDRNLALAGSALVGAQLVHLVHRGDTPLSLIFSTSAAVFLAMSTALISVLPSINEPVAVLGIILAWVALMFYLTQSMLAARRRILSENATKAQMFQAQKLSALGQLAGGIAHDFNNILTAISGNLELYQELDDEGEKRDVIAAAHLSSQRAAKIVNQILIYARKSPLELQIIDANEPLTSIGTLTEHLVPSNITFSVRPVAGSLNLWVDPDQLVTALMNLVVNAVDATAAGGYVALKAEKVHTYAPTAVVGDKPLPSGRYVVYSVADTGTGIPSELLPTVTDPFVTTKPVGKGTGLGLSMAASIADSNSGGLAIDTSPSGTVVKIYVPLAA